jgi:16S rRNA (cytosine967-C5)-methyltransferase
MSAPAWLLDSWERQFGAEVAERIARASLEPPDTYIRVPPGSEPPASAEPVEPAGCFRVAAGVVCAPYRIQDAGAQSVVPLLDPRPGLTFLDVCAAPGNKTAQALESGVRAVACDLHPSRLRSLSGLDCARVALDATRPLPFRRRFDRILADVPCSGTGTLARNPEIKWRIDPETPRRLHHVQVAILRNALQLLAPGGRLVYSTCSLEREENEAVLEKVLGACPANTMHRLPGRDPGDGFFAAVIPSD